MTDETLVVVYQMGKVASTAIVQTLDQAPNVRAVQSHFLGPQSLGQMVHIMTSADTTDYFYNHQFGQFVQNLQLTREIELIKHGKGSSRLVILSLSRDPLAWFRSSILQDIAGYRETFSGIADAQADDSVDRRLFLGLEAFIRRANGFIEAHGEIDKLMVDLKIPRSGAAAALREWPHNLKTMFQMMLRPFDWFDRHYAPLAGHKVEAMTRIEGIFEHPSDHARHYVIRYEDLPDAFETFRRRAGITPGIPLAVANESASKAHSESVSRAFQTEAAANLQRAFARSAYSRRFGYGAAAPDAAQADKGHAEVQR